MAGRLLALGRRLNSARLVPFGAAGARHSSYDTSVSVKSIIGNRDVVGYGHNGQPGYIDRPDFPLPAIRWKENTPDVAALREKEKGDWRKLSKEEKKALYRASFCQTFAEMEAPTGEWKSVLGGTLTLVSLGIWLFYLMKTFVYSPLGDTYSEEAQKAQLRRMIDLRVNPITGLTSKWDYEKDEWKK